MIDCVFAIHYLEKIHNTRICKSDSVVDKAKQGIGFAMLFLYRNKDKEITCGDLAKELGCSTARIAALLKKLEDKEYIYKKNSSFDARINIVSISLKGEEFIKEMMEHGIIEMQNYVDYIGIDDMDNLMRILEKTKEYFISRKEKEDV